MGQYDELSIYLSYILRHKPEEAYVNMAKGGWVSVKKLIEGVNKNGFYIDIRGACRAVYDSFNVLG